MISATPEASPVKPPAKSGPAESSTGQRPTQVIESALPYHDNSSCEGNWKITQDGPALRLDDGTLHKDVAGQP